MTGHAIDLDARVDDEHRSVLDVLPPKLLELQDIGETREGLNALVAASRPELPSGVTIENRTVPAFDTGTGQTGTGQTGTGQTSTGQASPDVLVRIYRPDGLAPGGPALYWIHGGGMVLGSVDWDDAECANRALELECLVASVEYRLAPEHPFPAPLHDCYAGLSWLAANATDLQIDADRIVIGGASAGGGLAAGLALMARDRGGPNISFQLLVYPMLDHRNTTPSSHSITDSRVWNRTSNHAGWSAYLGQDTLTATDVSAHASPALADDLAGLPPAYINVGDLDMFLDEDVAYSQGLNRAGVPTELHIYPGAFHGSRGLVSRSALSTRWMADENAALRRAMYG